MPAVGISQIPNLSPLAHNLVRSYNYFRCLRQALLDLHVFLLGSCARAFLVLRVFEHSSLQCRHGQLLQ
jgi:hypothetical protein